MNRFFTDSQIKYIKRKQNQICLHELERNYNKGEYTRVLDDLIRQDDPTCEENVFEKELNEIVGGDYKVSVSTTGMISIDEPERNSKLNEPGKICVYRRIATFFPTIETPYAYVMGKKIGKRVMQKYMEDYAYILKSFSELRG